DDGPHLIERSDRWPRWAAKEHTQRALHWRARGSRLLVSFGYEAADVHRASLRAVLRANPTRKISLDVRNGPAARGRRSINVKPAPRGRADAIRVRARAPPALGRSRQPTPAPSGTRSADRHRRPK